MSSPSLLPWVALSSRGVAIPLRPGCTARSRLALPSFAWLSRYGCWVRSRSSTRAGRFRSRAARKAGWSCGWRLTPVGVLSSARLVDALWDGEPPASADVSVRVLVSRVRKALAARGATNVIRTRPPGYVLAQRQAGNVGYRQTLLEAASLACGTAADDVLTSAAFALCRGVQQPRAGRCREGCRHRLGARCRAGRLGRAGASARSQGGGTDLAPRSHRTDRSRP
jgi:hypothetical protein